MEKSTSSSQRRDVASPRHDVIESMKLIVLERKSSKLMEELKKKKVAYGPTKQPSDELGGSTQGILVKLVNFTAHKCRLTI